MRVKIEDHGLYGEQYLRLNGAGTLQPPTLNHDRLSEIDCDHRWFDWSGLHVTRLLNKTDGTLFVKSEPYFEATRRYIDKRLAFCSDKAGVFRINTPLSEINSRWSHGPEHPDYLCRNQSCQRAC